MSLSPHPEMAVILRDLAGAPAIDLQALPSAEARAAFAANAAQWNQPEPPATARAVTLGGIACRLLLPASRVPGLILFVHGGGWTFGSAETHDRFARLLAEATGQAVLVAEYRLAPEHPCPAAIEDVLAVIAGLDGLAEADGPLSLCGDSAGANIALAAACGRPARPIAMLSLLYGCFAPIFDTESHRQCGDGRFGLSTARMQWYWRNWLGAAEDARAAPLHAGLAGLPRTHVLAAGLDPLRDDSLMLAARLAAQGVSFRLDVVPGVVHGFLQMSARLAPARMAIALIAAEILRTS